MLMMLAWAGAPGPVRLVVRAAADAHDARLGRCGWCPQQRLMLMMLVWGGAYGWYQQRLLLIMTPGLDAAADAD
ncbi:hypothetical protein AK812_SmicGene23074 [Symbiodinium microadriaticum]|uniref:Uncharacterized protein n=1 Tax=Symbiodinium microadriaticum TaxID=2951 RepID=A0A1Q9DI29_SYMMI|nr:hypothetical protein AK812_SmicGene23074 [Symbiodinium microadriaticum]